MVKECLEDHVVPWECKILRRPALSVTATIALYCKEASVGSRGKRVVKTFKDSNIYILEPAMTLNLVVKTQKIQK